MVDPVAPNIAASPCPLNLREPRRRSQSAWLMPSAEEPEVGHNERDHEVEPAPDPGGRGCMACEQHAGLVDQREDDSDEERDPDRAAEVLAASAVSERSVGPACH
jgi:hypothetical protein